MCVTATFAEITGTSTFCYAANMPGEAPRHVVAYQNKAETYGPNCMFLNFPGSDLRLVSGPERTIALMDSVMAGLEKLVVTKGLDFSMFQSRSLRGMHVEEYGDYTVILAQQPGDILALLDQVPTHRRPARTAALERLVEFYMGSFPNDSYVLACFNGTAKPQHPITVSYAPHRPDILSVPGLDGHDGNVPTIGAAMPRDFKVAFGIRGVRLPQHISYLEEVDPSWAPDSVVGFHDNRYNGPNTDYVVPVENVQMGLDGAMLAATLF